MPGLRLIPLIYTALAGGPFNFPDFTTTANVNLVGIAEATHNLIRLTPARQNTSGAFWYRDKQVLAGGFETTFRFQLTRPDSHHGGGSDGFAFVLQTVGSDVVAGQGGAAGFAIGAGPQNNELKGIPRSLAIFFDTHQNHELADPSDNYISVCTNSDGYWPPRRLAYTRKLPVKLKDGRVHAVRVTYTPPQLSVFMDDRPSPVLTTAVEIASVTDAGGAAYIGFTAATGSGYQNHDILSWSFGRPESVDSSMSVVTTSITFDQHPCLPNHTLCTPDQATVEALDSGRFHIILPANLEWGASIPNPQNRRVSITDVSGTVCRDPRAATADVCSDAAPGDLITNLKGGRTHLSIKGASDRSEGYFEFDVTLH